MQVHAIYPIKISEDKDGARVFTIKGIPLPEKELVTYEEEQVATALGYVCHFVFMLSKYLEVRAPRT